MIIKAMLIWLIISVTGQIDTGQKHLKYMDACKEIVKNMEAWEKSLQTSWKDGDSVYSVKVRASCVPDTTIEFMENKGE